MYSVTDKCSFDECCRLKFLIGYNKRRRRNLFGSSFGSINGAECAASNVSVVLVANKIDQENDRMVANRDGMRRSRDLECDQFFEISVREHVDFPKHIMEHLYSSWKRSHLPSATRAKVRSPSASCSLLESLAPPLSSYFGLRCLDTFSWCSTSKSTSMDVISEREDNQNPLSISLSLGSALVQETAPLPEKFRSRASTEGSLSYRKRIGGALSGDNTTTINVTAPRISTIRRMSISLRGAVSTF